ncbi:hypothetical protein ACIQW9_00535 [Herminiimonas sp. NPDC097707]|uniref:hypothetical protein n=1 Tax=Herminiimonas sp. NPDC097707 TaxID=3364007 RepID=UPI003839D7BB
MNKSPPDSGIPVLTEVILTPPRVSNAASTPVPPPALAPAQVFFPASTPTPEPEELPEIPVLQVEIESTLTPIEHAPITGWLDEEWTRLEQKISERVLTQIMDRIDTVLEQRIRESLADSVQLAVNELRQGLHETLEEVISDAVVQEIDKIHFSKN